MPNSPRLRSILITGGSSGLGAALAEAYAAPGVHLHLCGRDLDRLTEVAERCRNLGAEVSTVIGDVGDKVWMRTWIEHADDLAPLELIVANAGIGGGAYIGVEANFEEDGVRKIFDTNLTGVLNTILPILPRMAGRRRGQIALVASVSGWHGLPDAPAYSAAKAAVKTLGEALRIRFAPDGVRVNVILPGLVDTPMSAGLPGPHPFEISAAAAANVVRKGLERDRGRIAFTWPLAAAFRLLAALPSSWSNLLLARFRLASHKVERP